MFQCGFVELDSYSGVVNLIAAIIPARGGSKGIPRKNMQIVGGKTLIERAIETCTMAMLPVYVSTDSREIWFETAKAAFSTKQAIGRPDSLSTDDSSSWDALRHSVVQPQLASFQWFAWVQCTAPLLTSTDIMKCVMRAMQPDCDFAVACHLTHDFNLDSSGTPLFEVPPKRRQDLTQRYVISGSVWACHRDYILNCEPYSGKVVPVLSENPIRMDIDTPADLALARKILDTPDVHPDIAENYPIHRPL